MNVQKIPLKDIEINENSRVIYKAAELSDLMNSLKKSGQLQPVGVRKLPNGRYDLIFGSRRCMAAQKLGWADIDASIMDVEDSKDRDILSMIENLKRQNTSVYEDGRMFMVLRDYELSNEEIAARLDIGVDRVILALETYNRLPKDLGSRIVNRTSGKRLGPGKISATAAAAVLNLRKIHNLNRKQMRDMLEFAGNDKSNAMQMQQVAPLMSGGMTFKQAMANVEKLQRIAIHFFIHKDQVRKLEKKHGQTIHDLVWAAIEPLGAMKRASGSPEMRKQA